VSLDEIRNALAVVPGAKDHDDTRVPFWETVDNLCSPLVTFGKPRDGDTQDNPLLKLCHKTVEDFFLQDPEDLELQPKSKLRKYFVTYRGVTEAMAIDCLTYLQYKRYASPDLNVGTILSKPIAKEHAFLPYAAMFWAQHCDWIGTHPTIEVTQATLRFLQGPTLRTCLEVQARVGPYLFGRYVDKRNRASFQMCVKGSRSRENDSFGVPLPQWLDTLSSQGLLLDRSICHFIGEWREVLIQHPDGLQSCLPLRKFEPTCHLTPLVGHKHIRLAYLEDEYKQLKLFRSFDPKDVQVLRVAFRGKTLWVHVLFNQLQGRCHHLEIPLFAKKKNTTRIKSKVWLLHGDLRDWTMNIASRKEKPDTIEAWKLNPHDLGMRWTSHDESKERKVPLAFSGVNLGRRRGSWEIQSTQNLELDARSGSMQIVHVKWKSSKIVPGAASRLAFEVHGDSDSSFSESGEEMETVPAPASPGSASEDDSDDDSDDSYIEPTTSQSRATETADEASNENSEAEADEVQITDCLVVMSCDGDPSWHPWSGAPQFWSNIGCAAHPSLPLLAVSHTARQLEVIDTVTRAQKTKHLPDLADLQDSPMASLRGKK
jgi:hypothetical protein